MLAYDPKYRIEEDIKDYGDKEYLTTAYPTMKGAVQFFLETLVEDPEHHWLVTSPSTSPVELFLLST